MLKELLNSETTYFTQLKTLDFSFIQQLKNRKDIKVAPAHRLVMFPMLFVTGLAWMQVMGDPVFSNFVLCVPPIVSLSKELVYASSSSTCWVLSPLPLNNTGNRGALTSRINKMEDSDQVHVGETFVRLAPVFKMYQTYINKYTSFL